MRLISVFAVLMFFSGLLSGQAGWKTVQDKTGACQLSVPPTWTLLSGPGGANSPEHTTTRVIVGMRPFKKFREDTLKMLDVDQVYENSETRLFYVTKPGGTPPLVNYHVETAGKGNRCVAEITLSPHSREDEAKKIAMSLSATK